MAELKINIKYCMLKETGKQIITNIKTSFYSRDKILLVGASGVGKSTLFKTIMGFLPRSVWKIEGSIIYNKKNLLTNSPKEWENYRGTIFRSLLEEPLETINQGLKIFEQMDYSLKLANNTLSKMQRKNKIIKIFNDLKLTPEEEFFNRYPIELSIGQLQKISIALVLSSGCEFLLADEPTNSLDSIVCLNFFELVKKLYINHNINSFIFISHNFHLAKILDCNRVIVLDDGKIIADSTYENIVSSQNPIIQKIIKTYDWFENEKTSNNFNCNYNASNECSNHTKIKHNVVHVAKIYYKYRKKTILPSYYEPVVKNISFDITKGDFLGIIGRSGEGKTTLVKILTLLFTDYFGTLNILGRDKKSIKKSRNNWMFRRDVQLLPQSASSSFDPNQRIIENIIECIRGRHLHLKDSMDRIDELVKYFNLDLNLLNSFPSQLSSGEKQRFALIRILCGDLKLLIADEPFLHLDIYNVKKFMERIFSLKKNRNSPLTAIIISHDIKMIKLLCDKIIVIEDGSIVEQNSTLEIFKSPQKSITQKLIKASIIY